MSFEIYLKKQLKKHPSMEPQDIVKMCYQAAFGGEHLLSDTAAVKEYLEREYAGVQAEDTDLFESISDAVCRINLSAWKEKNLPLKWLFRMFEASSRIKETEKERFEEYVKCAESCLLDMPFSEAEWAEYMRQYVRSGLPAVHHSEIYRMREHPAYRIIDRRFCRILPVLEKANECSQPCIIAIDGRCASGKTSLAGDLQTVLDADVIHMDDFFLPPELRTEERLKEAGGNIHYERFAKEVLPFISDRKPFSYRIFDCGRMDYAGERSLFGKPFIIAEGSYSHHPKFGRYADIFVFSDVSSDEQIRRIRRRNGNEMLKKFQSIWIPMEEKYFAFYSVKEKADLMI